MTAYDNCFYFLQNKNIWWFCREINHIPENQAGIATERVNRGELAGRVW